MWCNRGRDSFLHSLNLVAKKREKIENPWWTLTPLHLLELVLEKCCTLAANFQDIQLLFALTLLHVIVTLSCNYHISTEETTDKIHLGLNRSQFAIKNGHGDLVLLNYEQVCEIL